MAWSRWKRTRHRVEWIFTLGVMLILWMVSLKTAHIMADKLGWFVFVVLRVRRKVVMDNLSQAFPEKSEKELLSIAKRTYQNIAKMAFEFVRFPVMSKKEVLSLYSLQGQEDLEKILKRGHGGVMVAGHFGNWELLGAALAQMGCPISVVVGDQHNRLVDEMMNRHRMLMGIKIIHMGAAVRGVIRTLRNNEFVALLSDQDAGPQGVFVDFFGRKSSTHQGPAVFALKTGAPIVFGSAIRLPGGRHRIVGEVLFHDHLKGVTQENIHELTQAHTKLLEKMILAYPDHWFWMHRRWKTVPPDEKKPKRVENV